MSGLLGPVPGVYNVISARNLPAQVGDSRLVGPVDNFGTPILLEDPGYNALSAIDATLEGGGIGTWTDLAGNSTMAASTTQAAQGTTSLRLTAIALGDQ